MNDQYSKIKQTWKIKSILNEAANDWKQSYGCYPTISEFINLINEHSTLLFNVSDLLIENRLITSSDITWLSKRIIREEAQRKPAPAPTLKSPFAEYDINAPRALPFPGKPSPTRKIIEPVIGKLMGGRNLNAWVNAAMIAAQLGKWGYDWFTKGQDEVDLTPKPLNIDDGSGDWEELNPSDFAPPKAPPIETEPPKTPTRTSPPPPLERPRRPLEPLPDRNPKVDPNEPTTKPAAPPFGPVIEPEKIPTPKTIPVAPPVPAPVAPPKTIPVPIPIPDPKLQPVNKNRRKRTDTDIQDKPKIDPLRKDKSKKQEPPTPPTPPAPPSRRFTKKRSSTSSVPNYTQDNLQPDQFAPGERWGALVASGEIQTNPMTGQRMSTGTNYVRSLQESHSGKLNTKSAIQSRVKKQQYKITVTENSKKLEIFASSIRGIRRAVYGKKNYRVFDSKGSDITNYFKRLMATKKST